MNKLMMKNMQETKNIMKNVLMNFVTDPGDCAK